VQNLFLDLSLIN